MYDRDDDLFRRAIDELAGPSVDPYAALRDIEPRLDGSRRRRRLTIGTAVSAMAASVALAVGVAAATRHQEEPVKVVAPASDSASGQNATTSTVELARSTGASPKPTVAPTSEPRPSVSSELGEEISTIDGNDGGGAGASDRGGSAGGSEHDQRQGQSQAPGGEGAKGGQGAGQGGGSGQGSPSTSARQGSVEPSEVTTAATTASPPTVSPPTTGKPAPSRSSYTTTGGKITYLFDGFTISDVRLVVDPGWVGSIERADGDKVEVTFVGGDDHENKVRLRVRGGQVVADRND